jgi:hypothetical protein
MRQIRPFMKINIPPSSLPTHNTLVVILIKQVAEPLWRNDWTARIRQHTKPLIFTVVLCSKTHQ